jgi:hypothetical protein
MLKLTDCEVFLGHAVDRIIIFTCSSREAQHPERGRYMTMFPCSWLKDWLRENDLIDTIEIRYYADLHTDFTACDVILFEHPNDALRFKLACSDRL